MIAKAIMLRCLLDANVIIEAYRLGVWVPLIERAEVAVPSIVAFDEALFYSERLGGIPEPIFLRRLIELEKIKLFSATVDQMELVRSFFDRVFLEGLHDGEVEALALLKSNAIQ